MTFTLPEMVQRSSFSCFSRIVRRPVASTIRAISGQYSGMAVSNDSSCAEEIAAVDKRIVVHNGLVKKNGQIRFGAAEHISFVLLEAMKADPDIRCLIEFSAPEEFVENMEDAGLEVTLIRKREESIAETVRTAIASSRKFPDVLADLSNKKNVTIEVLGKTPADVLSKMDMVL